MTDAHPPLIKVRLHNQGEDSESPWAEDLGPAPGLDGARRARLVNVPFLHAKPTFGDVIVVEPDDGVLTWDRGGLDDEELEQRIADDGGRYALIVDYVVRPDADVSAEFATLCRAARAADVMPEGCFGPRGDEPGRLYLAAPDPLEPEDVLDLLQRSGAACALTLIHPVDDEDGEDDSVDEGVE